MGPENNPERGAIPPLRHATGNLRSLLVAVVTLGRSLLAGVFLVAVLAGGVERLLERDHLPSAAALWQAEHFCSLPGGSLWWHSWQFFALFSAWALWSNGTGGLDFWISLIITLPGMSALITSPAENITAITMEIRAANFFISGSPPSRMVYDHRLHLAHRPDSRGTQSSVVSLLYFLNRSPALPAGSAALPAGLSSPDGPKEPRFPDLFDAKVAVDIQRSLPARSGGLHDRARAPHPIPYRIGRNCSLLPGKNQPGKMSVSGSNPRRGTLGKEWRPQGDLTVEARRFRHRPSGLVVA